MAGFTSSADGNDNGYFYVKFNIVTCFTSLARVASHCDDSSSSCRTDKVSRLIPVGVFCRIFHSHVPESCVKRIAIVLFLRQLHALRGHLMKVTH